MSLPVLMVFSPLRWDFVHQRPQQLLSRLAGRWQVLYVEEPVNAPADTAPWLEVSERGAALSVLVPHLPSQAAPGSTGPASPGADGGRDPASCAGALHALLVRHLRTLGAAAPRVSWLYTPRWLPLARALQADALVYDCLDRPRAGAGTRQLDDEAALLREAMVVLTAGPTLYEALHARHPRVVCLPSAVDALHFAATQLRRGSAQDLQAQRLQGDLPSPRLGYFGVIDERLDFELLDTLAASRPDWTVLMAGPVTLREPARLPRRPNLHWLGPQPYARLPYLLADWDLCLVPFAQGEATRYINPTKTLEYMAGDKPVVSTPVPDVMALYGEAVAVASTPEQFVRQCAGLLGEHPAARCRRAIEMLNIVSMHSWDRSADSVHQLLTQALTPARPAPIVAAGLQLTTGRLSSTSAAAA